jgi:hypothetical protein
MEDAFVGQARRALVSTLGLAALALAPATAAQTVSETARLFAASSAAGDDFGKSVAVDGDTALVGAPYTSSFDGVAFTSNRTTSLSQALEFRIGP